MAKFDKDSEDMIQLSKAVGYSRECLKEFRDVRKELLRSYVGKNYSENGAEDKIPVNLLEMAINIFQQRLVAKEPQVSVKAKHSMKLRELANRFEIALNQLIKEIDLGTTLERAVVGGLFSMGIVKVGLNRTQVEFGGYFHDSGQPFADPISLDNWVHDMTVDRMEQIQYEGDFYNVTLDEAKEMFPDSADKLVPRSDMTDNEETDHEISEGRATQREEYREVVRLLDLWLPKQNIVLQCLASDDEANPIDEILNVIEWDGPERGPYHKLGFTWIENNTMPSAPATHLKDLHDLTNNLFRKLGRQAGREKTILGVQVGSDEDANRITNARDGDAVRIDNPDGAREFKFGGISQETYGFFMGVRDLFSYVGGNLDMLGGLGPQSETLGQDQMLSASASMRIQKMQKEVIRFTKGVIEDLAYYLWNDPYIEIPVVKRAPGFEDVYVAAPFGPKERSESDFLEYNIDIEPYSMQHVSPEAKLQGMRTIFAEIIAPSLPYMAQQGISLDYEKLFKTISKLGNIKEIEEVLVFARPNHDMDPIGQMPTKSPVSTRRYERVSRPGATNSGKSQIIQQAAFGGKPQSSELASISRPTG